MKKYILAVTILLILIAAAQAQNDLRKGYILNLNNDTINGFIDFRSDMNNSKLCIFSNDQKTFTEYYPFEIKGYQFSNGKYYVSRFVEYKDTSVKIFAEYLVDGIKDLFYYRDIYGFHYLLSLRNDTITEIPYSEQIIVKDDKRYIYTSTKHYGYLKAYFSDSPELFSKIDKIAQPSSANLISLTKNYHELMCNDEPCIVYKKSNPKIKFAVVPHYGFIKLKYYEEYQKQYGGLVYLWLPRSNENIYFKTGLLYSKHHEDIYALRVPVKFQYTVPGKFIRPKFSIGVNAIDFSDNQFKQMIALTFAPSVGLSMRFTDFLFIDFSFETEVFEFTNETELFLSHSFHGSLFILI